MSYTCTHSSTGLLLVFHTDRDKNTQYLAIVYTKSDRVENVQKFAWQVITNNWTSGYESLCSSLGFMKLADRCRTQKLKLCYKIVNNLSCIPSFTLPPHPHPSPQAPNSKQLYLPLARTEAHKQSFFVNVVSLWNALPEAIVSAPSPCAFKHHLHKLYSV